MYFFRFKVLYYEKVFEESVTMEGLVVATDYGDASNKLLKYYGEENIVTIKLSMWDEEEVVEISKPILDALENDDAYDELYEKYYKQEKEKGKVEF